VFRPVIKLGTGRSVGENRRLDMRIAGRNPRHADRQGAVNRNTISDYFHIPVPHYKKLNIRFKVRIL
jgi:hypothetical protein